MKLTEKLIVFALFFMMFNVFSNSLFTTEETKVLNEFRTKKGKRHVLATDVMKILSGDGVVSFCGCLKKEITPQLIISSIGDPDLKLRNANKAFMIYYCGKNTFGNYVNIIIMIDMNSKNNKLNYMYDCQSNVPYKISRQGYNIIFEYKIDLYNKIIKKLKNNDLKIINGKVRLPDKFDIASSNKVVFATKVNNDLHVLFRTWIGKGWNMRGFLYVEKKINESQRKRLGEELKILDQPYTIIKKINDNWYYVSWSLD